MDLRRGGRRVSLGASARSRPWEYTASLEQRASALEFLREHTKEKKAMQRAQDPGRRKEKEEEAKKTYVSPALTRGVLRLTILFLGGGFGGCLFFFFPGGSRCCLFLWIVFVRFRIV